MFFNKSRGNQNFLGIQEDGSYFFSNGETSFFVITVIFVLGRGVGSALGGVAYAAYGVRTLFQGCAVLSGCGIILLAMGRLTYRCICLHKDTQSELGAGADCSNDDDDDERKPLLGETPSNSNNTGQS